jgi:hypothetical protein
MAVPSSGQLKLWNDIWNNEIGGTQGNNSLHSASVYAGFTTPDAMGDFYGWSDVEVPSVSTSAMSSVTDNSMQANGNVSSTGNEDVSRGFYFGTNSAAPVSNTKYTLAGTQGTGTFSCNRTGLAYNNTYYAWAFACNSAGESVGGRVQAGTPYPPFSPTCITVTDTQITYQNNPSDNGNSVHFTSGYINPYSAGYVASANYNCAPYFHGGYVNLNDKKGYTNAKTKVYGTGTCSLQYGMCIRMNAQSQSCCWGQCTLIGTGGFFRRQLNVNSQGCFGAAEIGFDGCLC